MTADQPRDRDTVRVTRAWEGEYQSAGDGYFRVNGLIFSEDPVGASRFTQTVEVLVRAEDPANAPIGDVWGYGSPHGTGSWTLLVKTSDGYWQTLDGRSNTVTNDVVRSLHAERVGNVNELGANKPPARDLRQEVRDIWSQEGRIQAIKHYRMTLGARNISLRDAKNDVEHMCADLFVGRVASDKQGDEWHEQAPDSFALWIPRIESWDGMPNRSEDWITEHYGFELLPLRIARNREAGA